MEEKVTNSLKTRKYALKAATESIKDESIQIIGIYGPGGVGKTTLAKEVASKMNNFFAEVVFVTLSQTVDVKKIKERVEVVAKRIIKGEKILIILDDLWGEVKLEDVGILCGTNHMNCKILLSTRNKHVCASMKVQCEIYVEPLLTNESWILFKNVIGENLETNAKLKQLAMEVAKECGGLPIIIQALGKSLKNKSLMSWEEALAHLKNNTPFDISQDMWMAYIRLKPSNDLCESVEAQSCFLLCSMFPKGSFIPVESLELYGVGLKMFGHLESIEEARFKVKRALDTLCSCFLLKRVSEYSVEMHDVIRDVALLIATKNDKYFVKAGKQLTEWEPKIQTLERYTGISLMDNDIRELPDYDLNLPLIDIFLLQNNNNLSMIPDEFILSLKEVKILDMEENNIISLPPLLNQLTRLCVLNLSDNKSLTEVSMLGELKTLEILNLSHTGITEIPQEFGQLVNLRRFDVRKCYRLSHIARGVISKFRWLEEFYIGYYSQEEGGYNSLVEITKLTNLTYLDLFVLNVNLIPEGCNCGRLKGFVIHIGGVEHDSIFAYNQYSKRYLILETPCLYTPLLKQISELINVSHVMYLDSVANLGNIFPTMLCEGLNELKIISVTKCNNMSCLVDSTDENQMQDFLSDRRTLKKKFFSKIEHLKLSDLDGLKLIWNGPDQFISFNNLVKLSLYNCPVLVKLLPVSVARRLVNLQVLEVMLCTCLEEVIWDGDEETAGEISTVTNIVFSSLDSIYLFGLTNLTSFYPNEAIIQYPSLENMAVLECHKLEKWGFRTHETPKLKRVNRTDGDFTLNEWCAKVREM